jgi:hypothetical protein
VASSGGPQRIRGMDGRSQGKGGDARSASLRCVTKRRRAP